MKLELFQLVKMIIKYFFKTKIFANLLQSSLNFQNMVILLFGATLWDNLKENCLFNKKSKSVFMVISSLPSPFPC